MKKKRKIGKYILVFILMTTSALLILYPFISNYIFENRADGVIETVEAAAENANKEEYTQAIQEAREYNESLLDGHIKLKDPFVEETLEEDTAEYNSLLNMTDDGVMGFIEIPSIDVSLPIYHGTSEEILEIGTGHLQGTSLPIGGESTHSVITGHTGLSRAKLFTDLTELEKGDIFLLSVMGEKLAYKVDQIKVVLPSEMNDLDIERGKDYCTLITCTPYGVNTHRLLVRGSRTDYKEATDKPFQKKKVQSKWMEEYSKSIIIAAVFFIILMVFLLIWRTITERRRRRKRRRRKKHKKKRPI